MRRCGDINYLDFEEGPTLSERKEVNNKNLIETSEAFMYF